MENPRPEILTTITNALHQELIEKYPRHNHTTLLPHTTIAIGNGTSAIYLYITDEKLLVDTPNNHYDLDYNDPEIITKLHTTLNRHGIQ